MSQTSFPSGEILDKPAENLWLWLIKILTGLLLILLLAVHFIVNHFIADTGLMTYADVVRYFNNPIVPAMEITFVAVVVAHALIGLRGILLDLEPSRQVTKVMDIVLASIGVLSILYGVWLAITIANTSI